MDDNRNIFAKMADYLYTEESQKKAYLHGCANCICLMQNLMQITVKLDDLISPDIQLKDIKVMKVMLHNNKILTQEDINMCKALEMPIVACNFSPRTQNGLIKMEIRTVKELLERIPDGKINYIRGFGRKCVAEIMAFLNDNNLYFGMMTEPVVIEKYAIYKWK